MDLLCDSLGRVAEPSVPPCFTPDAPAWPPSAASLPWPWQHRSCSTHQRKHYLFDVYLSSRTHRCFSSAKRSLSFLSIEPFFCASFSAWALKFIFSLFRFGASRSTSQPTVSSQSSSPRTHAGLEQDEGKRQSRARYSGRADPGRREMGNRSRPNPPSCCLRYFFRFASSFSASSINRLLSSPARLSSLSSPPRSECSFSGPPSTYAYWRRRA